MFTTSLVLAAVALVSSALFVHSAEAGTKAQVYLTQAKIPGGLTEKGLLGFARGNSMKLLHETTDSEVKARKWKANLVVSFSHAVDDMEFTVLFYDIQDGPRRFVEDMSTMVNNRNEKTFVQPLTLSRPTFKPNRQMELVVTVKREEVGTLKFGVLGEEIKRSGEVSFSDDETGAKKKK
ncbi:MAG TPA: hypothetical protein VGI70_05940, partial [Polyangiales bacterium]|jgi:hypothetical protein